MRLRVVRLRRARARPRGHPSTYPHSLSPPPHTSPTHPPPAPFPPPAATPPLSTPQPPPNRSCPAGPRPRSSLPPLHPPPLTLRFSDSPSCLLERKQRRNRHSLWCECFCHHTIKPAVLRLVIGESQRAARVVEVDEGWCAIDARTEEQLHDSERAANYRGVVGMQQRAAEPQRRVRPLTAGRAATRPAHSAAVPGVPVAAAAVAAEAVAVDAAADAATAANGAAMADAAFAAFAAVTAVTAAFAAAAFAAFAVAAAALGELGSAAGAFLIAASSLSIECSSGSRCTWEASSAAGCVGSGAPGAPDGARASSKCSTSWWSREKGWEGSRPVTSIVEQFATPKSRSGRSEISSVRPQHLRTSPEGTALREVSAGITCCAGTGKERHVSSGHRAIFVRSKVQAKARQGGRAPCSTMKSLANPH